MSSAIDICHIASDLREIRSEIQYSVDLNRSTLPQSSESSRSYEWIRRYDFEKGKYSWLHSVTKTEYAVNPWIDTNSSSHPLLPSTSSGWVEVFDERSKRQFWVNPISGKEQWIDPSLTTLQKNSL